MKKILLFITLGLLLVFGVNQAVYMADPDGDVKPQSYELAGDPDGDVKP
jgi:hypothetical protein